MENMIRFNTLGQLLYEERKFFLGQKSLFPMVQRSNHRDKGFKWVCKPFNLKVRASNFMVEGFE